MGGGVGADDAVGGVIKGDVVLTTLRRMGSGGVAQFWGGRVLSCCLFASWLGFAGVSLRPVSGVKNGVHP